MRGWLWAIGTSVLASFAASCSCGSSIGLVIELRTNLVPGIEVDSAQTDVYRSGLRGPVHQETDALVFGDPVADAVRLADVDLLEPGDYDVVVRLDRGGTRVVERSVHVVVEATMVLTVLITRDCRSLTCPNAQTCVGGICVSPDCSELSPEECAIEYCNIDADCTTSVACARASCVEHVCESFGDHTSCAADEYCDPELGCLPIPEGPIDGGPACVSGAACDDGAFCNGSDTCASDGTCSIHAGNPCVSSCDEGGNTCSCAGDTDCPADAPGPWSACAYTNGCSTSGTRARTVTTYTCTAGTCVTATQTQNDSGGCNRSTNGADCGSGCDGWGSCQWPSECAETGPQSRTCTDRRCSGGACASSTRTETRDCTRSTQSIPCGARPSYCGQQTDCYQCRGGDCVLNTPHFDADCNPSCGVAENLCGVAGTCCPVGSCTTVGPGPFSDCPSCCEGTVCF